MRVYIRRINRHYFVTSPALGKDYAYAAFTSSKVARTFATMLQQEYDIIGMSQRLNCRMMTAEDYRCWVEIERRSKHVTAVECPGVSLYEERYEAF